MKTDEERVHEILYSTDSREELAKRIASLEQIAIGEYVVLQSAYWQGTGFKVHGGISSKDMANIYDALRALGIEVPQ